MPRFTVTVESNIGAEWAEARREFVAGLREDTLEAAKDGAEHARTHHAYQDRTYHLTDTVTAQPISAGERDSFGQFLPSADNGAAAEIVWPMDYASFVDKGTSRSKAYPFSEEAEKVAGKSLDRRVRARVARIEEHFGRGRR